MRQIFAVLLIAMTGCVIQPNPVPMLFIDQLSPPVKTDVTSKKSLQDLLCANARRRPVTNEDIATLPRIEDHRRTHIPPRPIPPPAPPPSRIAEKETECLMLEQ